MKLTFCSFLFVLFSQSLAFGQFLDIDKQILINQRKNIGVQKAWSTDKNKINRGSGVLVAIVDSGVALFQPEIFSSIAINKSEIPGNKIDDDKNGLVDDVFGYDFVKNTATQFDQKGHGTHVAGIIAGQNIGVAPDAKIIPIRVLDSTGRGSLENVLKGISYAVDRGARIINLSLGAQDLFNINQKSYEAIVAHAKARGVLLITSAGNDGANNDNSPIYPANVWDDNLLSVCSVNQFGLISSFSNFGKHKVHLCAPGEDILSADFQYNQSHLYRFDSGTSMAAPFVTGVAALVIAANPSLKPFQVRDILMNSAKIIPGLSWSSQTGAVIDAQKAVTLALQSRTSHL